MRPNWISSYQRFRGWGAIVFAAVAVVIGISIIASGTLPSGVLSLGIGVLLAALGLILLDESAVSAEPSRMPGLPIGHVPGAARTRAGAVVAAVLAGVGALIEVGSGESTNAAILGTGAALVLVMGLALPSVIRSRTVPVVDPTDAAKPAWRRTRQFGRPRIALVFGAVLILGGAATTAVHFHGTSRLGLPAWTTPYLLIGCGLIVVVFAIRQLRAR